MIVPLFVGREKSIRALEEVMREDKHILLVAQKNAADDDPATDVILRIGTLAQVLQLLKLPDGTVKVLVEGASAPRSSTSPTATTSTRPCVEDLPDTVGEANETEALARTAVSQFESYVKLNKKVPQEVMATLGQITDYAKLADTIAAHLAIKIAEKQELLEILAVPTRLEKVFALMEGEISVLQVEKRIRSRVKRQMEKTQREYYLNEQMKAIQKELGDGEERDELQRARPAHQEHQALQGSARARRGRAEEAPPDEPDVGRSDGGAQLSRLAARHSVGPEEQDQARPVVRRGRARRRPFRPREGQGAHRRVSRRAEPRPTSCAARSCASSARRASARPRSASRSPRRRAASSSACRSAACATRPRSAATGAPISARCPARSSSRCARPRSPIRSSCSTRSTRWAWTSAAIRHRRCSRCSIPSRTRRSWTTISRSSTTSRT